MSNLNTLPIEMFLEKARIALKSNQKNIILDIREVQSLYDSIAVVMTRLAGGTETSTNTSEQIQIKVDGGTF